MKQGEWFISWLGGLWKVSFQFTSVQSHALEDRTVAMQLLQLLYGSGIGRWSCSKTDCPFSPFPTAGLPTASGETFPISQGTWKQRVSLTIPEDWKLPWLQQDGKVGHLSESWGRNGKGVDGYIIQSTPKLLRMKWILMHWIMIFMD